MGRQSGTFVKLMARDWTEATEPLVLVVTLGEIIMRLLIAVAVSLASPAAAQVPRLQQPSDSQLEAQLAANLARGDLLYEYDQAAWHTTDAMMAAVPDPLKKLLRGYVIAPDGNNLRATFYGIENGREVEIYSASWTGKAIVKAVLHSVEPRPVVADESRRLIGARNVALNSAVYETLGFCDEGTPNVAVIPGPSPTDPISVYLMTPQSENGVYPLGGHNRVDVKDGQIVSKRAFTKSCISLGGGAKENERLAMMTITHSLDPVPTEIHAFTVHTSGTSVQVVLSNGRSYVIGRRDGKTFATRDK